MGQANPAFITAQRKSTVTRYKNQQRSEAQIITATLEYVANVIVSPPQLDGEDNEFECVDVAERIRNATDEVLRAMGKP